jgi:hypothetical protein
MRRGILLLGLIALLAPCAALGISRSAPSLTLVDRAPLTVTGAHFRSRELVRVTALVEDGTAVRSVRAGKRGGFTARFPGLTVGRCGAFRVVAKGATGTRAILKLFPPAGCQPLRTST